MKKYLNIKTIFLIISILIIIAGVITSSILGLEKSIEYKAGTRIEVYIPKGYEKQDVIDIAKESFTTSDEMSFVEIEKLNQVAGIKVIDYTEEELKNYISKLSTKYEMEEKDIEYYEIEIPETKITTILKPYILPALFTTLITLIYIILKNFKTDKGVKIPLRLLKILVITLGLYFSAIALLRLTISIYTMPLALAIYIVTLLISVNAKCE